MARGYSDEQAMVAKSTAGGMLMPMDPLGRLQQTRTELLGHLERIDKAIAALQANPGIEEVLRLLKETNAL